MSAPPVTFETRPTRFPQILAWIGITCLIANIAQVLWDAARMQTLRPEIVEATLLCTAAVASLQVWTHYRYYHKVVTSIYFGIALIVALTLATITGTLVVQTANQAVFMSRYGLASPLMTWLHLNDLFHSSWFNWLLALLALALAVQVVRRRAWRWTQLGFLLSHGGIILLLIGGLVGQLAGAHGMLHLQTGESTNKYDLGDGLSQSLPFQLTLDRFVVDRRATEFRLYVMEKHNGQIQMVSAINPLSRNSAKYNIKGFGQLEILSFQADDRKDLPEAQTWRASPSVKLRLCSTTGMVQDITLGGDGPQAVSLGSKTRELRLAKKGDDIANFVSTLSIAQNGRAMLTQDVRVNQPLNYHGYSFYQASYDPKNPRYSGIFINRDPGLTLVYIALVAILMGVAHILMVRPRLIALRDTTA